MFLLPADTTRQWRAAALVVIMCKSFRVLHGVGSALTLLLLILTKSLQNGKNCLYHQSLHALYLINVTADKPEIVAKSVSTLQKELEFDGHIGGAGVVVHLGSHLGNGWDAVKTV